MDSWAERLRTLIDQGLDELPSDRIAGLLAEAAAHLRHEEDDEVEPLLPAAPVLGVVGCAAGWVGVLLLPTGRSSVHVSAGIAALVEQTREVADLDLIAVEIPSDPAKGDEIDHWLRLFAGVGVVRVDAAECFRRMAADADSKRAALVGVGFGVPGWFPGAGFAEDEFLDACAATWAAARALE